MSEDGDVTEEEMNVFNNSGIPEDARDAAINNVRKGVEYRTALDTRYGKLLSREIDMVESESLEKIKSFKHNEKLSIEQNYTNIMIVINKYNVAIETRGRFHDILTTKKSSEKGIRKINARIKEYRNHL